MMTGITDRQTAFLTVGGILSTGFVGILISFLLVERIGRRPLWLTSLFTLALGLIITAATLQAALNYSSEVTFPPVDPHCEAET